MFTSLYTAISGMDANGTELSAIGDNIANMNTVGFKSSRVAFGDVLSATVGGVAGSGAVGRGVLVSSVSPLFTQGSFQSTTNGLDLAIDGNGFFAVKEGQAQYYTRSGQFSLDKNGNIVNPNGLILQGFQADAAGNITGVKGDLKVASTQSLANQTAKVDLSLNLDAGAPVSGAFALNATTGVATNYNSSTTLTIYDSQGGAHQVTAYYAKTAANAWTAHYAFQKSDGTYAEAGTGQALTFGANGSLTNDLSGTAMSFDFGASAFTTPIPVSFNYGTGTGETPPGSGLDGTTQFASTFSVNNLTQDGYSSGSLKSLNIGQDGIMTGVFTNGQTRKIGQVELVKFMAPDKLAKNGRNLYAETFFSGQPIISAPNTSGLGRILSNSLESSNVDLAAEFVNMIAAQRGFQANTKTITTTDELMNEIVQLKR